MSKIEAANLEIRRNHFITDGKYAYYKRPETSLAYNYRIVDSTRRYGCMTTVEAFYEKGISETERKAIFLERRRNLSNSYDIGFDPKKFYMPSQTKDGSAIELTEEMIEACEDGWNLSIKSDILVVTHKTPGAVAGYPVADCPVLVATDLKNGITATAYCGAEMTDMELPRKTIEMMENKYNSKKADIAIYIGSHAGPNWTYDSIPKWAKKDFWKEYEIIKQVADNEYRIDLRKALLLQLEPAEFDSFIVNNEDTITNKNYYSNSAQGKDPSKAGRQFTDAYYVKKR